MVSKLDASNLSTTGQGALVPVVQSVAGVGVNPTILRFTYTDGSQDSVNLDQLVAAASSGLGNAVQNAVSAALSSYVYVDPASAGLPLTDGYFLPNGDVFTSRNIALDADVQIFPPHWYGPA